MTHGGLEALAGGRIAISIIFYPPPAKASMPSLNKGIEVAKQYKTAVDWRLQPVGAP